LNSILVLLTPEKLEQAAGIKPASRGALATDRNSMRARVCNRIATQANTSFHVPPHRPRPVFSKIPLKGDFQPNNFHSLPTFQTVNKSFSIK
jgi:hypothetical protein